MTKQIIPTTKQNNAAVNIQETFALPNSVSDNFSESSATGKIS